MSGDHHHDHEPDRFAHPGLPWPPPVDVPLVRGYRQGQPEGSVPHFWTWGPVTVERIEPRRVRTRDGKRVRCEWECRWMLDRVEGVSRKKALDRLYDVLLDPHGWIQTGIHFKRVFDREEATILVRVIPQDTSVCGPGSAGCYSYGYEPDRKPVAEMGVESINFDGPWRVIVGMELCGHGATKMEDMYTSDHQPYVGSMGTWNDCAAVGYYPTRNEIEHARQWLEKTIDPSLIHH